MKNLVLASSSPARKMLLARLNLPFETYSPNIQEDALAGEKPEGLVQRLTKEKGEAVAKMLRESALVISSDQVIVVNGRAISKPETHAEAVQQLREQSGQTVESLTGLGLLDTESGQYQYACIKTQVKFRSLSEPEMLSYLEKDPQAIHCAGALRVEALGITFLEKISSDDPTALIGLPLIALSEMLRRASLDC